MRRYAIYVTEKTQKCETCFKGVNHEIVDGDYPWTPCDKCGARALAEYQLRDIETMHNNDGQVLIGACVGSRKTGTTTAFINRHRGVWLGVVPLHTIQQWKDAIAEWSPGTKVYVINTRNKTGLIDLKESEPDAVHLIGWELLRRKDLKAFKNIDGTFLDEVHRMSGYDTATAKAVFKINSKYRIGLSGTPAQNALWKLWNVLHWIWWGNNDHKTAKRLLRYKVRMWFSDGVPGIDATPGWIPRHFYFGPKIVRGKDMGIEIGQERQFHSVVDEIPCYIQHLEYEQCCEFHPKGVNATIPEKADPKFVWVDMTPTQEKMYKQIVSGAPVMWVNNEMDDRVAMFLANDNVARLRARQAALGVVSIEPDPTNPELKKVIMREDAASTTCEAWLDLAEDIVEPDEPVLVFTHSKVFAKLVTARTNKRFGEGFAALWSGDQSQAERESIKQSFGREGGPRVIVAVIRAIAEGTDGLQRVCRREVWLSLEDDNVFNIQARGRLSRDGQKRRVQTWVIVTKGTLEAKIIKNKMKKERDLSNSLRAYQSV